MSFFKFFKTWDWTGIDDFNYKKLLTEFYVSKDKQNHIFWEEIISVFAWTQKKNIDGSESMKTLIRSSVDPNQYSHSPQPNFISLYDKINQSSYVELISCFKFSFEFHFYNKKDKSESKVVHPNVLGLDKMLILFDKAPFLVKEFNGLYEFSKAVESRKVIEFLIKTNSSECVDFSSNYETPTLNLLAKIKVSDLDILRTEEYLSFKKAFDTFKRLD